MTRPDDATQQPAGAPPADAGAPAGQRPDTAPPADAGATEPRPSRPRLTRRQALGLGGGAALAGGSALTLGLARARGGGEGAAGSVVAFHGARQAGVTTPRQSHAILALYDLQVTHRDELVGLLRAVSARARLLTAGALERPTTQGEPPPDSGTLGAGGDPQGLTITLGLGGGPFDRPGDPFGIAERRPRALKPMPSFQATTWTRPRPTPSCSCRSARRIRWSPCTPYETSSGTCAAP